MRRDIADLVRLIRLVQERRSALFEAGRDVAAADDLLATLRRELRAVWHARACKPVLEQRPASPAPSGDGRWP